MADRSASKAPGAARARAKGAPRHVTLRAAGLGGPRRPPLTPLAAQTRRIEAAALSPLAKAFFTFAFPGFFDPDEAPAPFQPDPKLGADENAYRAQIHEKTKISKTSRRFAGDILAAQGARPADLPRGGYHALLAPKGGDRGLLRNELLAYVDFAKTGGFLLLDGLIEHERGFLGLDQAENALFAVLKEGSPVVAAFQAHVREALVAAPGDDAAAQLLAVLEAGPKRRIVVRMNAGFTALSVAGALDLRRPAAQAWFYDAFRDLTRLGDAVDETVLRALAAERPPGADFFSLLPTLCSSVKGGGWPSQVFGAALRRLGVEALVFPSARCDAMVRMEHGALADWRGWNMVDYRGAPSPLDLRRAGVALMQWKDAAAPTAGDPEIGVARRVVVILDPLWNGPGVAALSVRRAQDGADAGSFEIDGLDAASDAKHAAASS